MHWHASKTLENADNEQRAALAASEQQSSSLAPTPPHRHAASEQRSSSLAPTPPHRHAASEQQSSSSAPTPPHRHAASEQRSSSSAPTPPHRHAASEWQSGSIRRPPGLTLAGGCVRIGVNKANLLIFPSHGAVNICSSRVILASTSTVCVTSTAAA